MKNHLVKVIAILAFIITSFHANAQSITPTNTGIEIGKKYSFYSKKLDENRELWVKLPAGYIVDDTTKYPVVYLLDGKNNFQYTAGLLRQLEIRSVPKSILVGIINTNRSRDLTPPASEEEEDEGGAENFLNMLEEELFPFIEKNFRTDKFRTIIGHSYGGLFAVYALAQKPSLFNAYLAISPSLWWDDQKFLDFVEKKLKENSELKGLVYLTMASERGKMLGGLLKLVGILESLETPNLRWNYKVHPNEHHGSIPAISTLEGFHFFYKDWHIPSQEFDDFGLEVIEQRKKRILKEFNENWEPENIIYSDLVWDLVENGKNEETLELSNQLLASGNNAVDFHETAAIAYSNLKNTEKAKYHFKEIYKLNPGYEYGEEMLDSLKIDKAGLINAPKLKAEDLKKYAGYYSDGENECTVEVAGNSLKVLFKAHYFALKGKVIPFQENHFYVPKNYYTIEFIFDESNLENASHVVLHETTGWSNKLVKLK